MSLHLRALLAFNVPEPRDPQTAALTLSVPRRTGIYRSHCSVPISRSETWSVSFCGLSPHCNDKCVRSCAERPLMKVGYGAGMCEAPTKTTYILPCMECNTHRAPTRPCTPFDLSSSFNLPSPWPQRCNTVRATAATFRPFIKLALGSSSPRKLRAEGVEDHPRMPDLRLEGLDSVGLA